MTVKTVRILLLGTGAMAERHVNFFGEIEGCQIVAGVDISEERLKTFCTKHKIPKFVTDLDEAIAWGEFDAASNVTPDAVHYPTTMKLVVSGVAASTSSAAWVTKT